MLLLVDLDNTLVDRRAAYKAWAESRFGESEVRWLVEADRDGYERRETLAAMIAARYGGDERQVLTELRAGMVANLAPDPQVAQVLTDATAAGLVPFVVTNGTVAQQEAKLRRTGLDRLVAGWTISEGAGVGKPDRRIFEIAAAAAGIRLSETGWMVGDSAEKDIGGGHAAGLRTAWVALGRDWPPGLAYRPEITGRTGVAALRAVIQDTVGRE
ncbi:HAD family hydrolase [Actinoplanes sp. KI2]|uniref:HAD family hydrolase n=1 Tax=Actinoplanes sp. KI2 TaxID=2983315 RepID=UPI0021D5F834|nr:HAD family hydrolase [Actinoplanes sp. KI2]MCU7728298.1 HAD family hydrolase [Actinoplanes sp. KI2]